METKGGKNCIYFHEFETARQTTITVCRRHSPQLAMINNLDGTPGTHTCWPRVQEDCWCGDYRPKPMVVTKEQCDKFLGEAIHL